MSNKKRQAQLGDDTPPQMTHKEFLGQLNEELKPHGAKLGGGPKPKPKPQGGGGGGAPQANMPGNS